LGARRTEQKALPGDALVASGFALSLAYFANSRARDEASQAGKIKLRDFFHLPID
jgi:hypothetical protein